MTHPTVESSVLSAQYMVSMFYFRERKEIIDDIGSKLKRPPFPSGGRGGVEGGRGGEEDKPRGGRSLAKLDAFGRDIGGDSLGESKQKSNFYRNRFHLYTGIGRKNETEIICVVIFTNKLGHPKFSFQYASYLKLRTACVHCKN